MGTLRRVVERHQSRQRPRQHVEGQVQLEQGRQIHGGRGGGGGGRRGTLAQCTERSPRQTIVAGLEGHETIQMPWVQITF